MYACPQGLSPKTLIGAYKLGLRKNGVAIPKGVKANPVSSMRKYRKVPMDRLTARLNLTQYNVDAPILDTVVKTNLVKIKLSQHIGAPAVAVVKAGDRVSLGQVIGSFVQDKLSVPVHASIEGYVQDVNDNYITIKARGDINE
jgi:biotin carboxyl carrier protein